MLLAAIRLTKPTICLPQWSCLDIMDIPAPLNYVRMYMHVLHIYSADVDVLLGEPIQAEISAHTGIELAYDSLATISLGKVKLLENYIVKAFAQIASEHVGTRQYLMKDTLGVVGSVMPRIIYYLWLLLKMYTLKYS